VRPPRKVKRKHGYVWEIRYRAEGRHKGRVFDRKSDAEDFQAEVRRRKRLGTLAQLHAGDELLADFAVEWWRVHAKPNLAPSTLHRYSQVWDSHVLPRLGTYRLKEITPEVVANLRADMTEAGVGDATTRQALFLLQGVLGLAVVRGAIASNPVKAVRSRARSRVPSDRSHLRQWRRSVASCARGTRPSSPCSHTRASGRARPWRCAGSTSGSERS
jgi:hypothetical protein